MKALVIGSGGREHALVKALLRSPKIKEVLVAPGNPGMAREARCIPLRVDDISALLKLAKSESVDFTVVGPELPLTLGIVDAFEAEGLKILGPNRAAAQLEASKAFTKNFLKKYSIPTAEYGVFSTWEDAEAFLKNNSQREWVVKVDGLAAGKGVFVSRTLEATQAALREVLVDRSFGEQRAVLEEFLEGEELSFMVLCDGRVGIPLASSQDHKRLCDGDEGPNTGGMGAYSPAPLLDSDLEKKILDRILHPTLVGMKAEGHPFRGILYVGLMIVNGEPYVLEFNVRFGDPEAQVILPRLESDWVDLFLAAISGHLSEVEPRWSARSAAVVVLAAAGYPDTPRKGDEILGIEAAETLGQVYFSGVERRGETWVTAGGRVLGVGGLGLDLQAALNQAYASVEKICFAGMQFRRDIGKRGLKS